MPNEHLKTALADAGLTIEEFAEVISVDPKTVQRWVAGRTPYARHRATISRALDLPEHELWPDTVSAPEGSSPGTDASPHAWGEIIGAWGHSGDYGAPDPVSLLTDTVEDVDLLDLTGTLLRAPGMLAALRNLAANGSTIRVITVAQALWPSAEPGGDQIQLRAPPENAPDLVVLRADDTMLLALQLHDQQAPPLFALGREEAGVFDRLAEHFHTLWESATPLMKPAPATAATPLTAPAKEAASDGEPPRRWPRRPPS